MNTLPKSKFNVRNLIQLVIAVVVPLAVGGLTGLVTAQKITGWYAALDKPFFNPPNWIFGPVWSVLYFLMGLALFLVIRQGLKQVAVKRATLIFSIQLGLNALWTLVFFGLELPNWASLVVGLLWLSIIFTVLYFWPLSKWAGALLLPYLLWVSFASVLNVAIVTLN